MNTHPQIERTQKHHDAPLYASPWVALFLVLRKELMQTRSDK